MNVTRKLLVNRSTLVVTSLSLVAAAVLTGLMESCSADTLISRQEKVECVAKTVEEHVGARTNLSCPGGAAHSDEISVALVATRSPHAHFTCRIYRSDRAECVPTAATAKQDSAILIVEGFLKPAPAKKTK